MPSPLAATTWQSQNERWDEEMEKEDIDTVEALLAVFVPLPQKQSLGVTAAAAVTDEVGANDSDCERDGVEGNDNNSASAPPHIGCSGSIG